MCAGCVKVYKNLKKRIAGLLILALSGCCFSCIADANEAQPVKDIPARFQVCHGYGCYYRTTVILTPADIKAIAAQFAQNGKTPQGERAAVKKAVAIFEERSTQVIGVRDEPKMAFGRPGRKGQMDCVDEAANTGSLLYYLKTAGYLKFHDVGRRTFRGLLVDGRYPHWTAVIVENNGTKWAVDSWYEPGGGEPDIMPLKEWKKRGVGGKR